VANESSAGDASLDVPQTERLVPRSRYGKLTARRDDYVRDKVVVAPKSLHGYAVGSAVLGERPDDERLVARTGDEHIWVDWRAGDLGDPVTVALEGATKVHNFRGHDRFPTCWRAFFCKFDSRL